jgi:hypothetical protein
MRAEELRLIASSIATFQLGEQSEGGTFLRAAERFARAGRHDRGGRIFFPRYYVSNASISARSWVRASAERPTLEE